MKNLGSALCFAVSSEVHWQNSGNAGENSSSGGACVLISGTVLAVLMFYKSSSGSSDSQICASMTS